MLMIVTLLSGHSSSMPQIQHIFNISCSALKVIIVIVIIVVVSVIIILIILIILIIIIIISSSSSSSSSSMILATWSRVPLYVDMGKGQLTAGVQGADLCKLLLHPAWRISGWDLLIPCLPVEMRQL